MKKNRLNQKNKELLSLGNLHEEIEQKSKHKKIVLIPISLFFCGLCLILVGVFYNDIRNFLNINFDKKTNVTKKQLDDKNTILTCTYEKDKKTLGLSQKTTIQYNFYDNLLKQVKTTVTMTIISNSYDIGSRNIKVYYQRYEKVLPQKIEGLKVTTTYQNDVLKNVVNADLKVLDITKIPKNDYIKVTNQKDQTYRDIKEQEGKAGHICKTL